MDNFELLKTLGFSEEFLNEYTEIISSLAKKSHDEVHNFKVGSDDIETLIVDGVSPYSNSFIVSGDTIVHA